MNKYIWLIVILAVVIIAGIGYRTFLLAEEKKPVETGVVREITITAKKDEWRFVPEEIEVNRGDRLKLTVVNEDDYDHGIGIDAFGISQRMPALGTIKIEFVVTQAGEFPIICSVPCGEGEVDGMKRGHFDMIGRLRVKNLVSETR